MANASEAKTAPLPHVALMPGDAIEVKFFNTPDLNESQTVRPDGKIALQLIGEIEVKGKSPVELRDDLLELGRGGSQTDAQELEPLTLHLLVHLAQSGHLLPARTTEKSKEIDHYHLAPVLTEAVIFAVLHGF